MKENVSRLKTILVHTWMYPNVWKGREEAKETRTRLFHNAYTHATTLDRWFATRLTTFETSSLLWRKTAGRNQSAWRKKNEEKSKLTKCLLLTRQMGFGEKMKNHNCYYCYYTFTQPFTLARPASFRCLLWQQSGISREAGPSSLIESPLSPTARGFHV